jgi:DHA2 family multidrug resistance protein
MLDPGTETGRALLERIVSQQAAIIAYDNSFLMMMVMMLLSFPLIALVRVQRQAAAGEAVHVAAD